MINNLFAEIDHSQAANSDEESIDVLAGQDGVRVERIVSMGHSSPPGFWYDQTDNEWVTVLKGRARLLFDDGRDAIEMGVGDHLLIPAHQRHRVEWTSPDEPTVWLAVFFPPTR